MITSLSLKGFKSWSDSGTIEFGSITCFFGANSSGKSSLIQFLLLLKQTAESNDPSVILKAGGSPSDYVDLGTFRDFIFNHDLHRALEFELGWRSFTKRFKMKSYAFGATIMQNGKQLQVMDSHYIGRDSTRITWTAKRSLATIEFKGGKSFETTMKKTRGLFGLASHIRLRSDLLARGLRGDFSDVLIVLDKFERSLIGYNVLFQDYLKSKEGGSAGDVGTQSQLLLALKFGSADSLKFDLDRSLRRFSDDLDEAIGRLQQIITKLEKFSLDSNSSFSSSSSSSFDKFRKELLKIANEVRSLELPIEPDDNDFALRLERLIKGSEALRKKAVAIFEDMRQFQQDLSKSIEFLLFLERDLRVLLSNTFYIGPLREYPHRLYVSTGQAPSNVGTRGEAAVDGLISRLEGIELHDPDGDEDRFSVDENVFEMVVKWFKVFGLIDEMKLCSLGEGERYHQLKLKAKQSTAEVLITDVGFGISQILPIIVQSYLAPSGSVILLEQPEIHLHPAIQADLADLLVDVSRTRNIQFIVESHSEHFLRRLQQKVAEESIAPFDVRVYFCDRGSEGSVSRSLQMNDFGEIENWPDNFFGSVEDDLLKMMELKLRRMKLKSSEPPVI
ncbi:MAG: DUF3696 domain-containing protein [Candidatus Melainabacteria bacterium]|nr:DUF3696 domain-containing protein [Candidatus Melainabacteria bacterium]